MKVLVVEDQQLEQKLAQLVLTDAGYGVERASTAEAAIDAVRTERPDVVLLDISLPGMDGLSFVRKLRIELANDVPVVAMTSYPEEFTREAALAAGCDGYLMKPISTRTLSITLREVMERAGRRK